MGGKTLRLGQLRRWLTMTGLIQIYTGNGKGKTTAALGLALRARGAGKRVAIVFFDKGGDHYSERKNLGQVGIDWFACGLDRIDPKTGRFRFGVIPEDIVEAEKGIAKARDLLGQKYDLLVLDEINSAVALGMISESVVEEIIDTKPPELELILTGRIEIAHGKGFRPKYFDRADLLTEMRLEKHYFYQGTPAREGIDF